MTRALLLTVLWLGACGDDGRGTTGSTGSAGSAATSDGGFTCEPGGGMCQCAGGCGPGAKAAPELSCPQPPDSAGGCSLECCLPATTSAGTSAGTTGESCDCASLPVCTTPEGEDCGGRYPTDQCCEAGAPRRCVCTEPCTGGYPCCSLAAGC